MANDNSFDIVSIVDFQEVKNAVSQAEKEIATRYDLKNARAKLELEGEVIQLESSDEFTLGQALEVVKTKLVRRGIHLKSLRPEKIEPASGGRSRQKIALQQGIPQETAKKIVAEIKTLKLKVQASIQGDTLRVSGAKKDDLQSTMQLLRREAGELPLGFKNFRD